MNELMVKPEFNEEIKAEIISYGKVEHNVGMAKTFALSVKNYFENKIYTEEDYANAKEDRASLNKMEKKVADYRKSIVADYKKEIDDFEKTCKETEKIFAEVSDIVDKQVKLFDEQKWLEKADKIRDIINEYGIEITPEFNPKWKNISYDLETIRNDIIDEKYRIESELAQHNMAKDIIKLYAESKGVNYDKYLVQYDYVKNVELVKNKIDEDIVSVPRETSIAVKEAVKTMIDEWTGEKIVSHTFTGTESQIEALKKYAIVIGVSV